MKTLLAFILGILLAAGAIWMLSDAETKRDVEQVGEDISEGMSEAGQEISKSVQSIDTEEVKENLKQAGQDVADKTKEIVSDAAITASIKADLAAHPEVSALSIDVDTTDGLVTLSGKVSSAEEIKRAVEIASAVKGVKQVISTLQVEQANVAPLSDNPAS